MLVILSLASFLCVDASSSRPLNTSSAYTTHESYNTRYSNTGRPSGDQTASSRRRQTDTNDEAENGAVAQQNDRQEEEEAEDSESRYLLYC